MSLPTSDIEQNDQDTFDVIIVGSSPVLLIEAIHLCSQGKKVAIFEKKTTLGGAWYTKPLWNLSSVEVGCHFIDKRKRSYDFIKKFMNLELVPSPRQVLLGSNGKDNDIQGTAKRSVKRRIRLLIESFLSDRLISFDLWNLYSCVAKRKVMPIFWSWIQLLRARPYMYPAQG
jgi:monoamine oxidase